MLREGLLGWAIAFVLVSARFGGFVLVSPFPGDRVPEPDDYAGLYTVLASEDARAVTGATLLADWGSSLRR